MNKVLTALFILVLFLPSMGQDGTYSWQVLESSAQLLRLKVEFAEPVIYQEAGKPYAAYKNARMIVSQDGLLLPHVVRFFNLAANQQTQVRIVRLSKQSRKMEHYFTVSSDSLQPLHISEPVYTQYVGNYRDLPLHTLHIHPVNYDRATQTLEWIQTLELEIGTTKNNVSAAPFSPAPQPQSGLLKNLFLNHSAALYRNAQTIESIASAVPEGQRVDPILDRANIYKIMVNKTGLYKVTYEDLQAVDFPLETINPKKLSLYYRGYEIPIYFSGAEDDRFDEGDYFEFWGEKNEKTFLQQSPDMYADPFSDESVYWLVENTFNGRRLILESGGIARSGSNPVFQPYAFRETLHFEEDRYHENFGHSSSNLNRPSHEIDHWYFDSGIRAPEGGAYNFYLPHPFESGSNVEVRAAFRGKSFYSYPTNLLQGHRVEVKLRGKDDRSKLVGAITPEDGWGDQTMRIISNADSSVKIAQSLLQHGNNRLEVDMFQTGVSDIVLLNWFQISYLRKYRADKNTLKFSVDADFFDGRFVKLGDLLQFAVDGFTRKDIDIYKLGVSKIVNSQIDQITQDLVTSYRVTFQDEVFDTDVQYVAVTDDAKLKPQSIKAFKPWKADDPYRKLTDPSNAADYLIITDNLFSQSCQRLKQLKEADGYRVEIVTVENIYDLFNFGTKSPLAIKDFIRYATAFWNSSYPLKYVVFVGDASYDYKGLIRPGSDMVPTIMYQTEKFGASGSDYWYALLDDDYIPDVSVARIPARTVQELDNYLDKIETYSQSANIGPWRNTALFIAGNDASSSSRELLTNQPVFQAQSLRLMDMRLPAHVFTRRLNTIRDESIEGFDPNFGSTTDLIEHFDNGVSFINFLGHGGGAIWADVNLLNLNDVERLNNSEKLPFVASMTCFTGAYENPGRTGLAEKLILSEGKGAIAVLASSGLGWMYNDMALEWDLFEFLWDEQLTFGEAVDLMKIYYLANPIYHTENGSFYTLGYHNLYKSMVTQYNLFGDPALRLQKPSPSLTVSVDQSSVLPGDSVRIHISGGPTSGNGRLEVLDRRNFFYLNRNFEYASAQADFIFAVPDTIDAQKLYIKAYVSSGSADAAGFHMIGIDQPVIQAITVNPESPRVGQPIGFELRVNSSGDIDYVKLLNFRDFNTLSSYPTTVTTRKIADTLFVSDVDFPGFATPGLKYFDVLIGETSGVETLERRKKLMVYDNRPDLRFAGDKLSYAGTDRLQLTFKIVNDSPENLSEVKVASFADEGIDLNLPFAETVLSLQAGEERALFIDYDSTAFKKQRNFKIVIDPDNRYEERSKSNNVLQKTLLTDHLLIRPEIGTTMNGISNETLLIHEQWQFFIPKETLSAASVLRFEEIPLETLFEEGSQVGLKPIRAGDNSDYSAIDLAVARESESIQFSATLSARVQTQSDSLSRVSFFRFDSYLRLWVQQPSTINGDTISTILNRSGQYALFHNSDDQEPLIEVSANGRPLVNNILVISKPTLSILMQDQSGINLNHSFTLRLNDENLVLNGQPINTEDVTFPDSLRNAKTVSILATPTLSAGNHRLYVEVADVSGNRAIEEVTFEVNQGFDILVFGNYPNPFQDKTIISFYVNAENEIDDLSVKIYTTSGRLIRSRMLDLDNSVATDNIKMPFHHELIWFGDDDNGNQVANGVYFAVVTGKYKGKTVKHTLKMARLQ